MSCLFAHGATADLYAQFRVNVVGHCGVGPVGEEPATGHRTVRDPLRNSFRFGPGNLGRSARTPGRDHLGWSLKDKGPQPASRGLHRNTQVLGHFSEGGPERPSARIDCEGRDRNRRWF